MNPQSLKTFQLSGDLYFIGNLNCSHDESSYFSQIQVILMQIETAELSIEIFGIFLEMISSS